MTHFTPSRLAAALLLAVLATGPLAAQAHQAQFHLAGLVGVGVAGRGSTRGQLGAELRLPLAGRLSASVTGSRWWFMGDCILVLGAPCDEAAWSIDGGLLARVSPADWPVTLSLAGRVGRLTFGSDRNLWTPSLGVDATGRLGARFGWQAEIGYHALARSRRAGERYPPPTNDQVMVRAGIHVRP